jgi:hypothetical protein
LYKYGNGVGGEAWFGGGKGVGSTGQGFAGFVLLIMLANISKGVKVQGGSRIKVVQKCFDINYLLSGIISEFGNEVSKLMFGVDLDCGINLSAMCKVSG